MDTVTAGLAIAVAVLALALLAALRWIAGLHARLRSLVSSRQSLSTKYGQSTEQFLPLVAAYPYDSSNFRFLGSPIDGVQFEEDRVILVEFKTGGSRLTPRQRQIRDLVARGRIDFEEIRVPGPFVEQDA